MLVKPLELKNYRIADHYRSAIRNLHNIILFDFDMEIGFTAGSLRAQYGLPLPDMLQAATALYHPARTLLTNDKSLKKIKEIDVFLLHEMIQ